MCNREILEAIIEEVGSKQAGEFCRLASLMYDIKYNACKDLDPLGELDFERDWWHEASVELKKQPKIK